MNMHDFEALEFNRQGAWVSSYSDHYQNAWHYYYEYEKALKKLINTESKIKMAGGIEEEFLESYIDHKTAGLQQRAYRAATSAHLYSCMAIEGFINYYGTRRLGQDIYKKLLERLGITEKLSLLYLLCFSQKRLMSDEPICSVRDLFDLRNSLVHPKTKELTSKNIHEFGTPHPTEHFVQDTMNALESFIESICTADTGINRKFYFLKPRK